MRSRSLSTLVATGLVAFGLVGAVVAAAGTASAVQPAKSARMLYLSLGDSYSVGYQNPTLGNTPGFTGYVAKKEKLQLENFGCGGATTTSLFTQIGCPAGASAATDGVAYPTTSQVTAVLDYIAAHPGRVELVTVSIGGNDVTSCAVGRQSDHLRPGRQDDHPDQCREPGGAARRGADGTRATPRPTSSASPIPTCSWGTTSPRSGRPTRSWPPSR